MTKNSQGILTLCPSTTPFGLALGPTNPGMIAIAQEILDFRCVGISPTLRLLISAFLLLYTPRWLAPFASLRIEHFPTTPVFRYHSPREFSILNFQFSINFQFNNFQFSKYFFIENWLLIIFWLLIIDYWSFVLNVSETRKSISSVLCLAPLNFRREVSRLVSCYALFKGWLLLSQPPRCIRNFTSFTT